MHTDEEEFRVWLSQRRETMASLRAHPSTERAYRFQFALSKATRNSGTGKTRAGGIADAKDENGRQTAEPKTLDEASPFPPSYTVGVKSSFLSQRGGTAMLPDDEGEHRGTDTTVSTSASPTECEAELREMVVESGEQVSRATSSPETLPSWAASLIDET